MYIKQNIMYFKCICNIASLFMSKLIMYIIELFVCLINTLKTLIIKSV